MVCYTVRVKRYFMQFFQLLFALVTDRVTGMKSLLCKEAPMKKYVIREKSIPLDDSWDVIVVGGGPSGCTAAIAAAREGAGTLLIEATGCLGGMEHRAWFPPGVLLPTGKKSYTGGLQKGFLTRQKRECSTSVKKP